LVFGLGTVGLSGLGYLAVIMAGSVAATRWGKDIAEAVEDEIGILWIFV
jgi:hypothetical protein